MTQQDKDYLDLMCKGLRAEIKSISDFHELKFCQVIEPKLDEIIEHQKESNGKLLTVDKETKFAQWVQSHPKLSTTFFILSICGIVIAVNFFGFKEIIDLLK